MSARFEFATATRIVFGTPLAEIGPELATLPGPVLLVTGKDPGRAAPVRDLLTKAGQDIELFTVDGEPTLERAREGTAAARERGCGAVVAMGGGSVVDLAKAIAALVANEGDPLEYVEVIGRGRPLARPSLPVVAIPTTAGTGSEVTRNAVLASPSHRVKVSLRSAHMLPRLAWIDPALGVSMSPALTASTGMDALSQTMEAFVCHTPNPLTDPLCRESLARAARALPRAYAAGGDLKARRDMCYVSLVGGLALANARLGAVHGFAAPLGGMFEAPHGALCAALLAPVMRVNIDVLRERAPEHPSLVRYGEVARLLTGRADANAEDGADWVAALCATMKVAPLSAYGVDEPSLPVVSEKAAAASSMKGNPLALTEAERERVLRLAL
jgi:alcohol dehydrogenase class IV